jgi:hypothetical protein
MIETQEKGPLLKILSNNVRSLSKNFDAIKGIIEEHEPHIFAIQEIWAPKFCTDIKNYTSIMSQRTCKKGGGLALYIKNNVKFSVIGSEIAENYEYQLITVMTERKINILNSYIPPKACKSKAITKMANLIGNCKDIIVLGDLNIDACRQSPELVELECFMIEKNLTWGLPKGTITRIGDTSRTRHSAIDHILTGTDIDFSTSRIDTTHSDHLTTSITLEMEVPNINQIVSKQVRNTKPQAIDKLNKALANINWDFLELKGSPKEKFDRFLDVLQRELNNACPFQSQKLTPRKCNPWFNDHLLKCKKRKQKLLRKTLKNRTDANHEAYIQYRRYYNNLIKTAKHQFYEQKFEEVEGNSAKSWSTANELLERKQKDTNYPDSFEVKGSRVSSEECIANEFNEFFRNIGDSLAKEIEVSKINFQDYLEKNEKPRGGFGFKRISETDIEKIVKKMKGKTSSSFDGMSNKLLKAIIHNLIKPITSLINLSLQTGYIPPAWKCAKIIPLFKSGNKENMSNYRPISLLPTLSKVIEKVVYHQLINYLEANSILYNQQFGFRKGRTTEDALHKLIAIITKAKQQKEHALSVFVDLKKAFDTVDIPILLQKLKFYGISNQELAWFENYLSGRTQRVSFKNASSGLLDLIMGVPQGSILGPLLFLLYINDLPAGLELKCILFADDTTLTLVAPDIKELYEKANSQLEAASDWFCSNRLSLHPKKTRSIHYFPGKNEIPDLTIMKQKIQRIGDEREESSFKYVGVLLDENLNFKEHIKYTGNKIMKISYSINRQKRNMPRKTKKLLYNGLIKPVLEYGINIYSAATNSSLKPLKLMQKKIIRTVAGAKYNDHAAPIFKKLKLLPMDNLIELNKLKLGHKIAHSNLPKAILEHYSKATGGRTRTTNDLKLVTPLCKTSLMQRFPLYSIPSTWNLYLNDNPQPNPKLNPFTLKVQKQMLEKIDN